MALPRRDGRGRGAVVPCRAHVRPGRDEQLGDGDELAPHAVTVARRGERHADRDAVAWRALARVPRCHHDVAEAGAPARASSLDSASSCAASAATVANALDRLVCQVKDCVVGTGYGNDSFKLYVISWKLFLDIFCVY